MIDQDKPIWVGVTPWHPLTEIPVREEHERPVEAGSVVGSSRRAQDLPAASHAANPLLVGVNAALIRILFDLMAYLFSSTTVRIKRLNLSEGSSRRPSSRGVRKVSYSSPLLAQPLICFPYPRPSRRWVSRARTT
jgi:hypothetical protein